MIYMVHGANADQVREMLEQSICIDAVYEMHGHPIADIARIYADLNRRAVELGIEPIGYAANMSSGEYTAYDRGDLCADIDRALGDLIERTMHRYMPRKIAQSVRRNKVSELADSIIGYDQEHGKST